VTQRRTYYSDSRHCSSGKTFDPSPSQRHGATGSNDRGGRMNIEKLNLNCDECIGNPEETKLDIAVMRITIGATEYLLCRRHAEQLSQALNGALEHRPTKETRP
jgi:hypothetical protein